jgi:KDO2-lipid IV(A) lauroyltransferase
MPRRGSPSAWARAGQRVVATVVRAVGGLLGRIPLGPAATLGRVLGTAAYWILRERRRVVHDNLRRAFGGLPEPERRILARRCFQALGVTAVECARLFFGAPAPLLARIRVRGIEHIRAAMAEGRGAFYLTGHFGNWELLAAAHVLAGYPLSVVARPLDNPALDDLVVRARARSGLRVIPKRDAVRGVRAALARGECVGILLDQDAGRAGVFVPFLGCAASTSRALAVLALKTRAPVVPAFLHRLPGGAHELVLEPAIPLVTSGDLERDIVENTARFTAALERHVRLRPEQWFWVHRRWKTRPD